MEKTLSTVAPKKLELIQVFRGLASVAVLLTHCGLIFRQNFSRSFFNNAFNFGGAGVDFFFVLSGFIIFYIHAKDIGCPNKVKPFLIKRLIRIYPIYWVILGLKIGSSWMATYANGQSRNMVEILKAIVLFPQDRVVLSSSFLGVSWTLSFEIFFYLVFGLAILFPKRIMFPVIGLWLLGSFVNMVGLLPVDPEGLVSMFLFSPLNLEFALGCSAAYLLRRYSFSQGQKILTLGLFLLTISIALDIYTDTHNLPSITQPWSILPYGIPCWLLILGSVTLESEKVIQVSPWLSEIGNASYSIYLAHGFFINNLSRPLPKIYPPILDNAVLLNVSGIVISAAALILGYGVYRYIENPMLGFCRRRFL